MYASSFSVKSDCGLSTAAEKISQSIVSLYVYPMGEGKNFVFSFTSSSDKELLREYISKDFLSYSIYRGKNVIFIQGVKKGHGLMNSVMNAGAIPLFPIIANNGEESFDYISYSRKTVDEVLESVSMRHNITSSDYSNIGNDEILSVLSRKQSMIHTVDLTDIERKVIKRAYKSGYFTWPRDYRLDRMVTDFKLSKTTLLYHIRNAERKILKLLME